MTGIKHERVVGTRDTGKAEDWNADHIQNGNHDCLQYQFLNQVIENRTSYPAGPVPGQIIFRSDFPNFFGWNGASWQSLTPSATIVVAADGTGNTTDIQEGIDALPAGGGVIYVKEGTYAVSSKIIINKDNVSIIGAGHSTIITNDAPDTKLIEVSATTDYFTLEGVYLNPTIALGGLGSVISFLGATTRSRVSNCWFENWEPRGIHFVGAGAGIIIENCVFEEVTGAGPNYAILINASSHVFLRGNFIYGGTNVYGIQLVTPTIEYVSILDNKIYNSIASISIGGVGKVTITGNALAGFNYGIWLNNSSGNVIGSNYMGTGMVGIFLEDNSDDNTMGNNRITNCDFGVVIDGVTENNNILVANSLTGNTAAFTDNGTNSITEHNSV